MEATSLDYQTLRNYAWVAGRFPAPRRRDNLSFQHHATIASLPEGIQDQWLDLASSRRWSITQLRSQVKAASGRSVARGPQRAATLQLAVAGQRHKRWEAAARKEHMSLTDWIVGVLDDKAVGLLDGM